MLWNFLRKARNRTLAWPSNPTTGYISKENKEMKSACQGAKKQNQPRLPPTDEWIKKVRCVHTMQCYSTATKRTKLCHLQRHRWTKGHYTRGNKPEIGDKYSIFLLIYASKSGKKVSVGNKAWKLKWAWEKQEVNGAGFSCSRGVILVFDNRAGILFDVIWLYHSKHLMERIWNVTNPEE